MKFKFTNLTGKYAGEYLDDTASVDLSKDYNPGSTAVHEVIHHLYPLISERRTCLLERKIWSSLPSKTQIKTLRLLLDKKTGFIINLVKKYVRDHHVSVGRHKRPSRR